MRSLLDTEEEEETAAREITLSTASLLGIFFGLVLICGVFFGFGYSMGRGTGQGAQAASLGTGPAAQSDVTTSAANQPPEAPAAPSQDTVQAPAKVPLAVSVKPAQADDDTSAQDAAAAPPTHVNQALVAATAAPIKPSARIRPRPQLPLPLRPQGLVGRWYRSRRLPDRKMPMFWFPLCGSGVMELWCAASPRTNSYMSR